MKKIILAMAIMGSFLISVPMSNAAGNGKHHMKAKNMEKATGEIAAIDAIENKLILKETAGEVSYLVEKGAKIKVNGKETKLSELKIGEKVTVHYKMEGNDRVATSIR